MLDEVLIRRALIDTGSTFSIVPDVKWRSLLFPLNSIVCTSSTELIGVGRSCVNVRGYIDVSLELAWFNVTHPLVVLEIFFSVCRWHRRAPYSRSVCVTRKASVA